MSFERVALFRIGESRFGLILDFYTYVRRTLQDAYSYNFMFYVLFIYTSFPYCIMLARFFANVLIFYHLNLLYKDLIFEYYRSANCLKPLFFSSFVKLTVNYSELI